MKILTLLITTLVFLNLGKAQDLPTQNLPVSYQFTSNETVIDLESPKTFDQKKIGLMGRTQMGENHGMIFIYPEATLRSFWMKNTLIPLDMIFLNNNKIIKIIPNVPPCHNFPDCPSYGPEKISGQVIELNAGRSKALHLQEGQTIKLMTPS